MCTAGQLPFHCSVVSQDMDPAPYLHKSTPTDWHLGWVQLRTIKNKDTINIWGWALVWKCVFSSVGFWPRRGTVGTVSEGSVPMDWKYLGGRGFSSAAPSPLCKRQGPVFDPRYPQKTKNKIGKKVCLYIEHVGCFLCHLLGYNYLCYIVMTKYYKQSTDDLKVYRKMKDCFNLHFINGQQYWTFFHTVGVTDFCIWPLYPVTVVNKLIK